MLILKASIFIIFIGRLFFIAYSKFYKKIKDFLIVLILIQRDHEMSENLGIIKALNEIS